jgi:S1-C subfamily serine protease
VSSGALIREVVLDSPAMQAGVRAGDIIVSFDGAAIAGKDGLGSAVKAAAAGSRIPVEMIRGSSRLRVDVILGP